MSARPSRGLLWRAWLLSCVVLAAHLLVTAGS